MRGLLAALLLLPVGAVAAGLETNGLPAVGPTVPSYSIVTSGAKLAIDTQLPNGVPPQTVSATPFQIASVSAELVANQATSTAGAATLNTRGGMITTEALATAPGASYLFTLTNSVIVPTTALQVGFYSKTNTAATAMQLTSVVCTTGQCVITLTNIGTVPLNGSMLLTFHV